MTPDKLIHVHLVSDSTGDTVHRVAAACLSQFEGIAAEQHVWSLIRNPTQIENVKRGLKKYPGIVIATFADASLGAMLAGICEQGRTPYIPVLDPIFKALGDYLGEKNATQPGKQHELNQDYFDRIDAIDFAMHHDDGQLTDHLKEAEVILVGVSRTSKTPTCIYLSHRGIKAANVPIVPGANLPPVLFQLQAPLIIGLTNDPERLVQIRQSRMQMLGGENPFAGNQSYVDPEIVRNEIRAANRLFAERGWPVIDTTRKSVEETAAMILQMLQDRKGA